MKYRSFLFLFVLFFALVAVADIRMTGPEVTASATADPGRANVTSTESASYDLLVKAKTETYGHGWVGVRAEGSLDTGFQLNPGLSIEKVSFLFFFNELEFTTAYARGDYTTWSSGSRTLTGTGTAAASAGGGSLSFSGGSFGIGGGSGRITLPGSTITDTASFTISSSSSGSGSGSSSGSSSSSSFGCSNNPLYNYCTDTGSCTTRSGSGVPGPDCGHNYCCCAPAESPTDNGDSSGSSSGSSSSSFGCSNNPLYNYCTDTGSCTTGSGSGVPGPQCGHNYCCCP